MTAIVFIIVFGMLVFIHELGHFATAKAAGITVHEFALGMGPKIFSYQGEETLYSLRALPIGGYVRMEGEDEESEEDGSFSKKKPLETTGCNCSWAFYELCTCHCSDHGPIHDGRIPS